MYKLFITKVNENNKVIAWYGGKLAIESKEQPPLHSFLVNEDVFKNAFNYKIVDNELAAI